jgi:hypothetical protein
MTQLLAWWLAYRDMRLAGWVMLALEAVAIVGWRDRRLAWSAACTVGPILLLWVLYRNLYPVPEFPNSLWPYAAFVWLTASIALMRLRPRVAATPLAEYS